MKQLVAVALMNCNIYPGIGKQNYACRNVVASIAVEVIGFFI
jgi:hypothetical protein